MGTAKEMSKFFDKIPWFMLLGLILVANIIMNYQTLTINIANAVTQAIMYLIIGFALWRDLTGKGGFNLFLMTGIFTISTMITWFSPAAELVTVSVWGLLAAQVFLAAATLTHYYPVKQFSGGVWHYVALLVILLLVIGGGWIYLITLGLYSQGFLWNLAVGILCFGYLMKKANTDLASFIKFASIMIALIAAFGFSSLALGLLP